jgi:hypothetical protein
LWPELPSCQRGPNCGLVALCGVQPKLLAIRFDKAISRGDVEESGRTLSVAIDSHPGKTFSKPISRKFGPAIPKVKCVNLALQGGSAHGAFTWGVLDLVRIAN